MDLQQTITFPVLHQVENNPESQETLELKQDAFKRQVDKLAYLLMNGKVLTQQSAMNDYGISDLRSRSRDLSKNGYLYSKSFINESRVKQWYMTKEQIEFNKKFKP